VREFKDHSGQAWSIDLSIGNVMRVKAASESRFNLFEPGQLGEQLAVDEAFFWELLVYLCEPQAAERNVSAEQFGKLMASDCLFDARRLFFDAWLDFFQKLRRQDKAAVVQKVAAYLAKAMELTVAKLASPEMQEIDKLVESRMQSSLNASFGQLRDSLASTPALSPGGK